MNVREALRCALGMLRDLEATVKTPIVELGEWEKALETDDHLDLTTHDHDCRCGGCHGMGVNGCKPGVP